MRGMKENRRKCECWVFSFSRYSCIIAFSLSDFILIEKWTLFISFLLPIFFPPSFFLLLVSFKFFWLLLFYPLFWWSKLNLASRCLSEVRVTGRRHVGSGPAHLRHIRTDKRSLVLTNLNSRLIFRCVSWRFEITGTLPVFSSGLEDT